MSLSTVKRRLQMAGLNDRLPGKKPLLRRVNKMKRLRWAKEHKNWTMEEWQKVFWTDESKFEIFGSRRRIYVRRRVAEKLAAACIVPTVKHGGGSVMIWGCFEGSTAGNLIKIKGILVKERYKQILQRHVIPSGTRLNGREFIFQEDDDPKHSSRLC